MSRTWLRRDVLADLEGQPNDVTVVIGIRNRADHRLVNALRSIRDQTHPADLVHPVVVDYGSTDSEATRAASMCRDGEADYVRVEADGPWSRARCLNVGIRRARTKFLLTSDVDIVFTPRYIGDAVATLVASPFSVVCTPMYDAPEASTPMFQRAAATGEPFDLGYWQERSSPRLKGELHPSVAMTYAAYYSVIRGYDEYYEVWGAEDIDLMKRLSALGLSQQPLRSDAFYLHQWHPKYEGVAPVVSAGAIERNRVYLRRQHTILRNGAGWGRPHTFDGAGHGSPSAHPTAGWQTGADAVRPREDVR